HLAGLKHGAVIVPLSPASHAKTLEFALKDSQPGFIIVDQSVRSRLEDLIENIDNLKAVFIVNDETLNAPVGTGYRDFWTETDSASSDFQIVETAANAPAFVFYSLGPRGVLKGVVHTHGSLLGQLTAFEMYNNLDLGEDTIFWTNDDPAGFRALYGFLYPAWH